MSNITDNPKIQVLKAGCSGIFTNYIYKAIPLAFDESMSYYETLAGLRAYLKDVILPTVNGNAEAVAELQELYIQLNDYVTNYFDNLDVQEEINNKLDEMVEDGTFESILLNYTQIAKVFDTYNDMMLDTSTYVNGMKLKTLGYHYINDGGGAEYFVTNVQNETKYQVSIGTNLWIELILKETMTPEMFGAYGDGVQNDTLAFSTAEQYLEKISLISGKVYLIENFSMSNCHILDGNKATLKDISLTTNFINISTPPRERYYIKDIIIDCPHSSVGIYCTSNILELNNSIIRNATDKNIFVEKNSTYYGSCIINGVRVESSNVGIDIKATDCFLNDIIGYNNMIHVDVRGGLTHLNKIHGWNFNTNNIDFITGSTLIRAGSDIVGSDIYSDTLENCIDFNTTSQYVSIMLNNVNIFINTSSYPSTQQDPLLFKNYSNFKGHCNINGFTYNGNNWKNANNEVGTPIPDEINTTRVVVTQGTIIGGKVGVYYPYRYLKTLTNSATDTTADLLITNNSYLAIAPNDKKIIKEKYKISGYATFSLKAALPNNTEIFQANLEGGALNKLDLRTSVKAIFRKTTGESYLLDAFINNEHILYIYNNTGSSLNNGSVSLYFDYDNFTL